MYPTHTNPKMTFIEKNSPPKISCVSLILVLDPRLTFDWYINIPWFSSPQNPQLNAGHPKT